jgi:hypothetical protein
MSQSNLFKKFATDKKAEAEGLLYEVPGLFRVRLARVGGENKKFLKKMNELMKPYRKLAKEDLPEATSKKINLEVYCSTVILPRTWQTWVKDESEAGGSWVDGIEGSDGQIVPATTENYIKILGELSDLLMVLISEAADANLFRKEALEAEVIN